MLFKEYNRVYFFLINFFTTYNDGSLSLKEGNIIKYIGKLFRLEKETKEIKDKILKIDIKNLFKHEEENYHKPIRVSNFWSNNYIKYEEENYHKLIRVSNFWCNNYIEYESNGERNKTLSV